jgi:hypothetical protein
MSIRTGDLSREGMGGRKIVTKRNPEMTSFPVVYGPGATFYNRAIYPGRMWTQVPLIGHNIQKTG